MRRALPAALLTGALVVAAPLAASAHVHVEPEQAAAGEATDLAFTVPNEIDAASTTQVRITLPASLGALEPRAVRGWIATVSGRAVVFRSTGDGIGEGGSQSFTVHVATVPAVGSVLLPVTQTYSDGTVVEWDEATPASGQEPEYPAPTLYVQDTPPPDDDDGTAAAAQDAADQSLPLGLAAAALVVALGALAVGLVALLRRR